MKKALWIILAVVVYLGALVALIPARFAMQFAPLPEYVQVGGISGSIWHGRADALRVGEHMLRDIEWQLAPLPLLTGQIRVAVNVHEHADNILIGSAQLRVRSNQLAVYNLHADARLTDILAFAPQPVPVPVRGQLELQIDHFIYGQPVCNELQGRLYIHGGAIQVGRDWETLGPMDAHLHCADGQVVAEISEPNPLGLSASVHVHLNGARGEFELSPGADAPRTVRNLINMLPAEARQRQSFSVRF